jgi:hypothetical protein
MKRWIHWAALAASAVLLVVALVVVSRAAHRSDLAHRERRAAADELFRRARDAQLDGDASRALDLYRDLVARDPFNGLARLQLGILLQDSLNDPIEAMHEFDAYLRLEPGSEKRGMVEERRRIAKDQAVRLYGRGGDAGAPVDLGAEAKKAISALQARLDAAQAALETAEAERDDYRRQAAELQRQVSSLQRRLDALQGGPVSSFPAPTRDLVEAFHSEPGSGSGDAAASDATAQRTYRVKRGDTLWKIAQRAYGDASRNVDIRAANLDKIGPKDQLVEGTILLLP